MYRDSIQSVLRCPQCNKPFDKEATLKRHGYYCRSRKGLNTPKARSCISCVRSKARCDNKHPSCARCIKKGIECSYPTKTGRGATSTTSRDDSGSAGESETTSSVTSNSPEDASSDGGLSLESAVVTIEPDFSVLEDIDWDKMNLDITSFSELPSKGQVSEVFDPPASSLITRRKSATGWNFHVQHDFNFLNPSIPQQLPSHTLRSLFQRPRQDPSTQRISKLILHTLKSYPQMVIRHGTLPPYIHACTLSLDGENGRMEPLNNCISLVRMLGSGARSSYKLFWKNVRLECERWCSESPMLDKWQLLSALQALSIYILIRLDEGQTEFNNLDGLLLSTVVILSKQFNLIDVTSKTHLSIFNSNLQGTWKDWIFEESRRRICILYQVLDMLVYFEPAALCDMQADLVLAPLPATKQLWEAADEYQWSAIRAKNANTQTAFGLASNGDLVELFENQQFSNGALMLYKPLDNGIGTGETGNWEEWCAGMDGFGGLVMLAASLLA